MQRPKEKFSHPTLTAKGEERAWVTLKDLKTLWLNTGTQCNLSCTNCYIESSPKNDRLSFLTKADVVPYLEEIKNEGYPTELIGITGGEPFLNPHITDILKLTLERGFKVLVLTNALRMINRYKDSLLELKDEYSEALMLRVSLDHHTQEIHEKERGLKSFEPALENLKWLFDNGFNVSLAGRSITDENIADAQSGYEKLLGEKEIGLDVSKPENIVIFPEMASNKEVPEITTACWDILSKTPDQQMCASERMIVKRKGVDQPVVLPCTLLAYDEQFELGTTLKDAKKDVHLNHKFCAEFCVLGGASCSSTAQ